MKKENKKEELDLSGINLWNLDSKLYPNKTRNVVAYVEQLQCPYTYERAHQNKFNAIKDDALTKITPDAMLETIGYRFRQQDEIFSMAKKE